MRKIAFIVAIPMTAKVFLLEHIVYLQQKYEVHVVANFEWNDDLKAEFGALGIICHHVIIMRQVSLLQQ